ncbi:terminase small subunit [Apilactobacillus micheneri]|uniref:Terminase small subunit n=1 Tax=Apilactobacillus micheneri TaxID=1899430 RepID=A0ABY2Z3H5_9LACO|nr:terminase small subunit [Apilactobacillus micheneri]TPR26471.1 terminase small subunit [Apilactobacillus micheneri]TPR27225.1 terminase small subunit [Apilactobacillus micheneri]TPR27472.1 terminase small subunit [Apilactobacillus micheneri]TPR31988.1 terminase small subunit [Apilactobacillus micheneri]TPR32392.1 terminase small subunit [Apilactobacillus micheneri]
MNKWDKVKNEYENTDISMRKLASKYDVNYSTLRVKKNKEQWNKNENIINGVTGLENSGLTNKEQEFCIEYLNDFNATRAYRDVYKCKYRTARVKGCQLLAKDNIKQNINDLKKSMQGEKLLTTSDVVDKLIEMFFMNTNEYVKWGNRDVIDEDTGETYKKSYLYLKDSEEVDTSLIDGVSLGVNGASVKPYNKMQIAKLLLEYLPQGKTGDKVDPVVNAVSQSMATNKQDKIRIENEYKKRLLKQLDGADNQQMNQLGKLMDALEVADTDNEQTHMNDIEE